MRRILLSVLFLLATTAWSQSVQWKPVTDPLIFGQPQEFALVFSDCQPAGDVVWPALTALRFTTRAAAFTPSGNGGNLVCQVRVVREGEVIIPAFPVPTTRGALSVPRTVVTVGPARIGDAQVPLETVAKSSFELPATPVWAGEIFPVTYAVDLDREYFYNLNGPVEWTPAPLVTEEWSKPELAPAGGSGDKRTVIRYHTRALAREGGAVRFPVLRQSIILKVGMIARGAVTEPKTRAFTITPAPARLQVRPLPTPRPANFSGIVGAVKLSSKLSTGKAAVGEPVTWSITLEGIANWPDVSGLPARPLAKELKTVPSVLRRNSQESSLFNGGVSEDLVFVATKPGAYSIGPAAYLVFNPEQGKFETLTTPAATIEVEPASAAALAAAAKNNIGDAPAEDEATAGPARAAPVVPRDPIATGGLAPLPMSFAAWLGRAAWIAAAPLAFWLVLAFHRAFVTDPARAQRRARARLRATLRQLAQTTDPQGRFRLLRQWQVDVAILWKMKSSTPTTADFDVRTVWPQLWLECNTLLFAEHPGSTTEWAARAAVALEQKEIARFSPLKALHRQNLNPLLALVMLGGVFGEVARLRAAEPAAAYRRGNFAAAEAAWRGLVSAHPTDWAARHNLSLALAQLGRWDEAVGEAAAAFVQRPGDASVWAQLALTAKRAGYRPEIIEDFIEPNSFRWVARHLSPTSWQQTALFALGLITLGIAVWLAWAYGHAGPHGRTWARGLMSVGAAGLCIAGLMLALYGQAGRASAAVVWHSSMLRSVPIEGEITQETSPVAAGAVVQVTHTFLGWSRLAFAHGETGWMRSTDLVPLWSAPAREEPLPAAPRE